MDKPANEHPATTGLQGGEQQRFISDLLDHLAQHAPETHDALLRDNPDLVNDYGRDDQLRQKVAIALSQAPLSAQRQALIERTATYLERRRETRRDHDLNQHPGILTSLTRHLSPEKGIELYRKIAPVFAYQILNRLNKSAPIQEVRRIVDHLCSDEVQARLKASTHVRDAILDEIRTMLDDSPLISSVTREDLYRLLEETGDMNDLVAMENCIRLAASRAG